MLLRMSLPLQVLNQPSVPPLETVTVYILYYVESAHQNIGAHQNQARTKINNTCAPSLKIKIFENQNKMKIVFHSHNI